MNIITDENNTKKSFESKEELKNAVRNFNNTYIIEKYGDISNWNVSNVTDMSYMFSDSIFDEDMYLIHFGESNPPSIGIVKQLGLEDTTHD